MKVLVTGGAGYVGSHSVRALCDAGHSVVVFDNLQAGHREAVDHRAKLIVGDLGDLTLIERTFAEGRIEAVLHFAALAEVGESVVDPLRYYRNNVVNSVNLIDAMRRHEVRRFIFSSSCAVYGAPEKVPIAEDTPKNPISPYGRTKLTIEWVLQDSAAAWGLGATALRYFNAAGASADGSIGEDHDPESHLIPRVLQVALGKSEKILIFGNDYPTRDGTCIRDYVHVEDLALVHRIAIEKQQEGGFLAFNVGTGLGVSVSELVSAAREVTGHPIPADVVPRRPGDPPALWANASRIKSAFQWKPTYDSIHRTIETAWQWHRMHPRGFGGKR